MSNENDDLEVEITEPTEVAPEKKEYVIPTHKSAVIIQLENGKLPTPRSDVVCVTCKHGVWRINREKERYGLEDADRLECYCKHLFQTTYISTEYPYETTACDSYDNSLPEQK